MICCTEIAEFVKVRTCFRTQRLEMRILEIFIWKTFATDFYCRIRRKKMQWRRKMGRKTWNSSCEQPRMDQLHKLLPTRSFKTAKTIRKWNRGSCERWCYDGFNSLGSRQRSCSDEHFQDFSIDFSMSCSKESCQRKRIKILSRSESNMELVNSYSIMQ